MHGKLVRCREGASCCPNLGMQRRVEAWQKGEAVGVRRLHAAMHVDVQKNLSRLAGIGFRWASLAGLFLDLDDGLHDDKNGLEKSWNWA